LKELLNAQVMDIKNLGSTYDEVVYPSTTLVPLINNKTLGAYGIERVFKKAIFLGAK